MQEKIENIMSKGKIIINIRFAPIIYTNTLGISPDDRDSVQFALGVKESNIIKHQLHPPGFPVHIFLGKILNFFLEMFYFL